jgi:Tol biopolymer transport system component
VKRLLTALVAGYAVITVPAGSGAPTRPLASAAPGTLVFVCSGCPQKRDAASLYVVRPSGKGLRRIETGDLQPYYPRWSPKGRWISAESRGHEIWIVGRGGLPKRRLTRDCCGSGPAAWSPDGRRLVFSRRGVPFTSTLDGKRQRRFLANWRRGFREPDWSPDGRTIVFEGNDGRLYLVRSDGRAPRALGSISGSAPRWSPDGRSIAFLRQTRTVALMLVGADGKRARVVREATLRERYAALAWSPNGRSIAVSVVHVSDDPAQPYHGNELVLVPLGGSRPRRVVIPAIPRTRYSEFYGLDWR